MIRANKSDSCVSIRGRIGVYLTEKLSSIPIP